MDKQTKIHKLNDQLATFFNTISQIDATDSQADMLDRITWGFFDDLDATEEDKLCSAILKRAKQKIALYSEKRLYDREGVIGAKFVLDHHFHVLGQKEAADIRAIEKNIEYKMQELEMKKQMMDVGDEDNNIQITIVRKED